jgi:hypothetical protein
LRESGGSGAVVMADELARRLQNDV